MAQITSHPLPTNMIIWGFCIVISKVILDVSEYCLVLDEWNPVIKNPQQILLFCMFGDASSVLEDLWVLM